MKTLQDLLYQRLKDTPFRVWHYFAVLTLFYIVPSFLPSTLFQSVNVAVIYMGIIIFGSFGSNTIGRSLARQKNVDSVLIARYFAVIPWVIFFASSAITLILGHTSGFLADIYRIYFGISIFMILFHSLGIIIHHKKAKHTIKNIKKDELFQ